jgi:hypothetical protein
MAIRTTFSSSRFSSGSLPKSRLGRAALYLLLFGVAWLIVMVPVGILGSSNIVWGEDNQDGRVDVPGTAVLNLPSGSVQVSAAIEIPGAGNETADLPIPDNLSLSVGSATGGAPATVTPDLAGSSSNASDDGVNTQRRVFKVDVPSAGDYRVVTHGDFLGIGDNAQLWFGHGPPIPGTYVPWVALVLLLLVGVVYAGLMPAIRRARAGSV